MAIGYTAAAGYSFLPELITTARERLAAVDFVVEEMVTAEQVEGLASHRMDVALLRPPVDTRSLQHYLGHKNIQHTVRYSELSPERSRDFWKH